MVRNVTALLAIMKCIRGSSSWDVPLRSPREKFPIPAGEGGGPRRLPMSQFSAAFGVKDPHKWREERLCVHARASGVVRNIGTGPGTLTESTSSS